MHEVLVFLADGASFYILLDPGSCSWPEIVVVNLSKHLISPPMSSFFMIMLYFQDFKCDVFIWWYYESVF